MLGVKRDLTLPSQTLKFQVQTTDYPARALPGEFHQTVLCIPGKVVITEMMGKGMSKFTTVISMVTKQSCLCDYI